MDFHFFPPANPDSKPVFQNPKWRDRPTTYQPGDEERSSGWRFDNWERDLTVPGVELDAVFQQSRARIISMDILSPSILEFTPQWNVEDRLPQVDDLIFQRTHLIQFGRVQLMDVLSATRVGMVTDEAGHFALQYIATKGHPEKGFSIYTIQQHADNVKFSIKTVSQPANILTKLANPIITRRTQLRITNAVLDYVKTSVRLDLIGDSA